MKKVVGVYLVLIMTILCVLPNSANLTHQSSAMVSPLSNGTPVHIVSYTYIDRGPIEIDHELDFIGLGCSGSGTLEQPYIIEGFNITSDMDGEDGVSISDVDVYFVIRKCIINVEANAIAIDGTNIFCAGIYNNTCTVNGLYEDAAIEITGTNISCTAIYDNICAINNDFSVIRIDGNTVNCPTIHNNYCEGIKNSEHRIDPIIYIKADNSSESVLIMENTCINGGEGLALYNMYNATVVDNYFDENIYGIYLDNCSSNVVDDNFVINSRGIGIYVSSSFNSTIKNNECKQTGSQGIYLSKSNHSTINNNKCIDDHSGISVDESSYSSIINNLCNNSEFSGVVVGGSDSVLIQNNTCTNHEFYGIKTADYQNGSIINNFCSGNEAGIRIYYGSDNTSCSNNVFVDNNLGCEVIGVSSMEITDNTCQRNSNVGIMLVETSDSLITKNNCSENQVGISTIDSNTLTIEGNNCSNNRNGIELEENTVFCLIINNLLAYNTHHGVSIQNSDNNIVHHNYFIENNLASGDPQAVDYGEGNIWYDVVTNEGNYWSDYNGRGNYTIEAPETISEDPFPLDENMNIIEKTTEKTKFLNIPILLAIFSVSIVLRQKKQIKKEK